jgi:hypothetical protein
MPQGLKEGRTTWSHMLTMWWAPSRPSRIILMQPWTLWNRLHLKPTIYTPPLAISWGDDRDTWKTPYRSKDCKDRRGDAAGATPGCPFASINTISISNMMKTDPLDMAIMEVTCIKLSLVLHRLESHELSIMIVTIFCITYVVDLMFVRLFMRYKDIYFLDVWLNVYVTLFLFAGLDHTSMLGRMWGMCALVGAIL